MTLGWDSILNKRKKVLIDLRQFIVSIELGTSRTYTTSGFEIELIRKIAAWLAWLTLQQKTFVKSQVLLFDSCPSFLLAPSGNCHAVLVSAICATFWYRIGILSPSVTRPRSRVSSLSTEIGYALAALAQRVNESRWAQPRPNMARTHISTSLPLCTITISPHIPKWVK